MRLFIALPLPSSLEFYLGTIIDNLRRPADGVKWVDPHLIHLTVRFLGETDSKLVNQISQGLDKIVSGLSPVEGVLDRVGAFPNLNRPRVVWVGIKESTNHLHSLADSAEQLARELGFAPETKPFKGHLTLGRVKDDRKLSDLPRIVQSYALEHHTFRLDRLVLFQSTLTPKGPVYRHIHDAELRG